MIFEIQIQISILVKLNNLSCDFYSVCQDLESSYACQSNASLASQQFLLTPSIT